jgi:hypothetical protein
MGTILPCMAVSKIKCDMCQVSGTIQVSITGCDDVRVILLIITTAKILLIII